MKRIYIFLLSVIALLAFAPVASSQTINEEIGNLTFPEESKSDFVPYTLDASNIAYKKQISEPLTDGTYWIKLETFVTGEVKKVMQSTPADIVLVLDCSKSMQDDFTTGVKRYSALHDAVEAFINLIDINDQYETYVEEGSSENVRRKDRLGNRIAIVTFNSSAYTRNTLTYLTNKDSFTTTLNNINNSSSQYYSNGTNCSKGLENAYSLLSGLGTDRKLRTVVLFTDGVPGSGAANSNPWGTNRDNGRFTEANATINLANNIKNIAKTSTNAAAGVMSNVFTVSIINTSSWNQKNQQITEVYLSKTSSDYLDATNMGSFNSWSTTDMWSNGNGTKNSNGTDYSLSADSVDELVNAFETIAADSGGSSSALSEDAVATVDIVSASFMLPSGATKDNIKVFTAACTGIDNKNYLTFGTEVLAPNSTDTYDKYTKDESGNSVLVEADVDVDNEIAVTLTATEGSSKNDKIGVDGFDFGNNWCGPVKGEGDVITGYHGHKIIIMIPIQMDPNAVGGVGVETNASGSGIYVNGESILTFSESPSVNLPVNIHIRKEGLYVGESAKFTIQRVVKPADMPAQPNSDYYETLDWEDVSSVFVTMTSSNEKSGDNAPLTKAVGLPSSNDDGEEFIYRVKEDNWSWSYTTSATTATTSDQLKTNPFIFTNTKKENIDKRVRHAESKATNTFKTGGGATYDDSKGDR